MIPEPAEHTFAVWFSHAYSIPWQTWYRDDTCTSDGERWIEAHQYGQGTSDRPKTWADLCAMGERMRLDGPHLLVPANLTGGTR